MQNVSLVNFLTTNFKKILSAEVTVCTEVKLNKRGNQFSKVLKSKTILATLNMNYQDAVNQQRLIENTTADFKAVAPLWGVSVTDSVINHNDNYYIQMIVNGSVGKTVYHDEHGNVLNFDDFRRFLPTKNQTSRQDVENAINIKRYKVESIKKVVIRSPMLLVFTNE